MRRRCHDGLLKSSSDGPTACTSGRSAISRSSLPHERERGPSRRLAGCCRTNRHDTSHVPSLPVEAIAPSGAIAPVSATLKNAMFESPSRTTGHGCMPPRATRQNRTHSRPVCRRNRGFATRPRTFPRVDVTDRRTAAEVGRRARASAASSGCLDDAAALPRGRDDPLGVTGWLDA